MKSQQKMSFIDEVAHNLKMAVERNPQAYAEFLKPDKMVLDYSNDPPVEEFEKMLTKQTQVNCKHWQPKQ